VPRVKTVAPGVSDPARTSPSTGPVRGGTVVTVDHEIWQPLSQAYVDEVAAGRHFLCLRASPFLIYTQSCMEGCMEGL
jgi:hypothetical protein